MTKKSKFKFKVHIATPERQTGEPSEIIKEISADEIASPPTGVIFYDILNRSTVNASGDPQPQEIELKLHVSQTQYLYTEVEKNA